MKALEIKDKIQYGLAIAYNVSGDDAILKEYVVKSICNVLPSEERDFSITTIEGVVPVSDIINTAQTASFFAGSKRILIVKDYIKDIKGQDNEKLLEYVQDPNDDCTIVFVDCGKSFKIIEDYCVPVDCNKATYEDLANYVKKILSAKGYTIDEKRYPGDALKELIERCDRDMGKLTQELNKLIIYCNQTNHIKLTDVEDIVCMNTENNVFDLTNAIIGNEKDKALALIDTMLKRGEKPSALLGLITSSFRKVFWVANTNSSDEDMAKMLGTSVGAIRYNKKSVAKNKASRRGYIPYLKGVIDMLNELEYKFKCGIVTPDEALKLAMAHLLG